MKILLTVILSLVLVAPVLASDYKSFADLHPQISDKYDMPVMGIIKIKHGLQYTALAECKKLNRDAWFQVVDTAKVSDELDGEPDYITVFFITPDGFLRWQNISYERGMFLIVEYCKENNVDIKGFLHWVKSPSKIDLKNAI